MTRAQALQALETGARLAEQALDAGADLLATGEMGIGNTTAASAIAAAITGAGPERVTGRGTGVDDATLARKVDVVRRALAVNVPDARDGLDVLAKVGGFEVAGLVGVLLAGAARRVPVVLDGFISGAAALVAVTLAPDARHALFASHRSAEPGVAGLGRAVRGEERVARVGGERHRDERGGARDKAVEDHGDAAGGAGEEHADEPGDLKAADLGEDVQTITRVGDVHGERAADDVHLTGERRVVHAGAAARDALGAGARDRRGDRARRGGVADPHLAGREEIGARVERLLRR